MVPAYFDLLIQGFHSKRVGRDVHLGYWDDPPQLSAPVMPGEFEAAQGRLTELMVGLARLADGQHVLDVGCGFGGTLGAAASFADMQLVGVNIDQRQLDICRSLPAGGNSLSLVAADACALPFSRPSFDRVICVEAMFHFPNRRTFLKEAATVLRPGGRLVLSDILLQRPTGMAGRSAAEFEQTIRDEYGPWPELWIGKDQLFEASRLAGLQLDHVIDATRQTLPTYRITAPEHEPGTMLTAGQALRWLHSSGHLTYLCASFIKA